MKLKAVFLDFGNTIVDEKPFIKGAQMGFVKFVKGKLDSAPDDEELYRKLKSTPCPLPEHPMLREIKNREYYGRMLWGLEFARSCGIKIDGSTEKEMMEAYDHGAKCSDCLIGNAAKTLKTLSENYKLCIVSNGYAGFLHATLEHYSLGQYFTSVIVSHDVNIEKPDRRIYDLALADCGIKPQEALMVGDSYLADIWGAKTHGLLTCWINPDSTPLSFSGNSSLSIWTDNFRHYPEPTGNEHDFVIKEISELPGVLRKHNL